MYEYSSTVSLVKDVGNELRTMHFAGNCKQAYKYVLQLLCYCCFIVSSLYRYTATEEFVYSGFQISQR